MLASVRALLERLIDYAGMFPPARLPMPVALNQYLALRGQPEAWMLSRFVCPAAQLTELLDLLQVHKPIPEVRVVALGRGGAELTHFVENLAGDLQAIDSFRVAIGQPRAIEVIEFLAPPLPTDVTSFADTILPCLPQRGLRAFVELSLGPGWQDDVNALTECLSARQAEHSATPPMVGMKIRCGGATPAAFPQVEQLAWFIGRCREAAVPWKATAGLHHPLRHRDAATGAMAHGFLNVFVAGVLARVHSLDGNQIASILREESGTAFRFTDDRLVWGNWECGIEEVREARQWLPSFGSCSFDEPRNDLRDLGLLT